MPTQTDRLQPRFKLVFFTLTLCLISQYADAQEVIPPLQSGLRDASGRGAYMSNSRYISGNTTTPTSRNIPTNSPRILSGDIYSTTTAAMPHTGFAGTDATDFRIKPRQSQTAQNALHYAQMEPAAGVENASNEPPVIIPSAAPKGSNNASATPPAPPLSVAVQPVATAPKIAPVAKPAVGAPALEKMPPALPALPAASKPVLQPVKEETKQDGLLSLDTLPPVKRPEQPATPLPPVTPPAPATATAPLPSTRKEEPLKDVELPALTTPPELPGTKPVVTPVPTKKIVTPLDAPRTEIVPAPAPIPTPGPKIVAPASVTTTPVISAPAISAASAPATIVPSPAPKAETLPPALPIVKTEAAILPTTKMEALTKAETAPQTSNAPSATAPAPALQTAPTAPIAATLPATAIVAPVAIDSAPKLITPPAATMPAADPLPALAEKAVIDEAKPAEPVITKQELKSVEPLTETKPVTENSKPVESETPKPKPAKPKQKKKARKEPASDDAVTVAPPPRVLASTTGADTWDNDGLSYESRRIISRVPSNLDRPKHTRATGPIRMDRSDPRINELFPEDGYTSKNPVGISIEVKRPNVDVNYELEKAYEALMGGQREVAIEIYRNLIKNDPNNKMALFGLATTYHRAGQLDLARPIYGRLLTIDPNNREALNNFLALIGEESPQEALSQLQALKNRNPDFSPIPAQMAVIYDRMGQHQQAVAAMQEASRISPENLTYRYNLAVMFDKMGNRTAAAVLYRDLLAAAERGEMIPGNAAKIQERLTIIGSNAP